jgi:hypothetical protein
MDETSMPRRLMYMQPEGVRKPTNETSIKEIIPLMKAHVHIHFLLLEVPSNLR